MADPYFLNNDNSVARTINGEQPTTPLISTELDSVRAYQWEVGFFFGQADPINGIQKPLTLAAKQVNGIGFQVETIEVNRVNDKVYYPGRPSMEQLVVTFDNLQKTKVDKLLYEMMAVTYDPRTGDLMGSKIPGETGTNPSFKNEIQVTQLTGDGRPRNVIRLFGCYPEKVVHGEYNYSTNDFHTIEMTFRYDYFVNTNDKKGTVNGTVG
tara:strand:+ start:5990 stop:6619 length:630 start_codon:yes stop_codon:yes gene_type:complete